jgi:ubiquinone/menaquinone biosynthesis C-methylase UbiE
MENILAGNLMQRCRTLHLAECRTQQRALLVGEGTGKFLAKLLLFNPTIEITCVEQSQKMINQIRARLARQHLDQSRVHFENTDFGSWPMPANPFDLIATHFFLDCFSGDRLPKIIAKLSVAAAPGAVWLVSDFQTPARGWQRCRATLMIAALYHFFRWTTAISAQELIPPDPWIHQAGFQLERRQFLSCSLVHADVWKKVR